MAHYANFAILAFALGFASSSAEQPLNDTELSSAVAAIIAHNGLACAQVLDVRALAEQDQFEVLCFERTGETVTALYIMNMRDGTAIRA